MSISKAYTQLAIHLYKKMEDYDYLISLLRSAKFYFYDDYELSIQIPNTPQIFIGDLALFVSTDESLETSSTLSTIGKISSIRTLENGTLLLDINFDSYIYNEQKDIYCYIQSPNIRKIFTINYGKIKEQKM